MAFPMTAEEPDITLPAEKRKIGGLGIYMVKKAWVPLPMSTRTDRIF